MVRTSKRLAVFVVAAAVISVGMFGGGRASADANITEVGGGAWGIGVNHITDNTIIRDLGQPYGVGVFVATPTVTLPTAGSTTTLSSSGPAQTIGSISAIVGPVTTTGTPDGAPYAHSTAQLTKVHIPGVDIAAIQTDCTWDTTGATGHTTIVDANGHTYQPAPDTGYYVAAANAFVALNSHYVQTESDPNTGFSHDVITVYGVSVFEADVLPGGNEVYTEIDLGVSSCDPHSLPPVTSLHISGLF